ncbi:MAG TPA: SsrA-binding protein SmpB [Kofleriaceae bacterium]|nr:SsrA-binding protein SmpB [Kofleriaceae bacterium]
MGKRKDNKHLPEGVKVLVRNRRATYDYAVSDRVEAGIALLGSEVKSLREGHAVIADGHAVIRNGEAWLVNVKIQEYPWANQFNHEPTRERKLLLHRSELKKLATKTQQRGYTLIPMSMYLKDGKIKVELGLATGKRQYDKRQAEREKNAFE